MRTKVQNLWIMMMEGDCQLKVSPKTGIVALMFDPPLLVMAMSFILRAFHLIFLRVSLWKSD